MYFCRRKDIFILNDLNAMKEVVRITEADLKKMVAKSIKEYINEGCLRLNYENPLPQSDMIVEMATINRNEQNIFPFQTYRIEVRSNDHTPPHFHIVCEKFDISFKIENGELYRINRGDKNNTYEKLRNMVIKWLKQKSATRPQTNQENAIATWHDLHS